SPAHQIRTVLLSVQALLSVPNPDDPLVTDVAKYYKENEKESVGSGQTELHGRATVHMLKYFIWRHH
ncbi:hypothetical protein BDP27DRAFT_1226519, partial [Rhodocollybia butyracea]